MQTKLNLHCSVAQSPSSPLNHWQEGQLGSGRDEGGEEGGKEWEEKQENCTGTLDSIRTEGSLEEPRYAKVIFTLAPQCGHFCKAGDSQAEERFKLNAKAGAEKRRGAKDSEVEDDDETFEAFKLVNLCLADLPPLYMLLGSHSVANTFEFATGKLFLTK